MATFKTVYLDLCFLAFVVALIGSLPCQAQEETKVEIYCREKCNLFRLEGTKNTYKCDSVCRYGTPGSSEVDEAGDLARAEKLFNGK